MLTFARGEGGGRGGEGHITRVREGNGGAGLLASVSSEQ